MDEDMVYGFIKENFRVESSEIMRHLCLYTFVPTTDMGVLCVDHNLGKNITVVSSLNYYCDEYILGVFEVLKKFYQVVGLRQENLLTIMAGIIEENFEIIKQLNVHST